MIWRRVALLVSLCACGPAALPPPKVLSISPAEMVACEGSTVSVLVDAVLPTHVDYGQSEATANPALSLRIGAVPVGTGTYLPGGVLTASVPPVFVPGVYDVGVRLSDGRPEGILSSAFTVTSNPYPDSYGIDFVNDQTRRVPFAITIRAVGPNSSAYNCTVSLSSNRGVISPAVSGPFQRGVRTQTVTIDSANASVVINVQDDIGRSGSSNPFRVNP
jgi:hypothetical protein